MTFRLVFRIQERRVRALLEPGDQLAGSGRECQIHLPHPTVSRLHARIAVDGETVLIEDLGSSNGTWVNSHRIGDQTQVSIDAKLAFGTLEAELESVDSGDLEVGAALEKADSLAIPKARPVETAERTRTTLPTNILEEFTLRRLPELSRSLCDGRHHIAFAQEAGGAAFNCFSCVRLTIRCESSTYPDSPAIWFTSHASELEGCHDSEVTLQRGDICLQACFVSEQFARIYTPVLGALLELISVAAQRADLRPGPAIAPTVRSPQLPSPRSLSRRVEHIYQQAAQIAVGDIGVLIQGASGTGKEILARFVHTASGRPRDRFVPINCAALPRDLLELELFGIEKGVATGVDPRAGCFEMADGGTLFLDEIGDMAVQTQAKILRVLQERELYRIGAKKPRKANVRIVAATNRDIEAMMASGDFRNDLFHRIAGWVVHLPTLRERSQDIANLSAFFLAEEAERHQRSFVGLSKSAIEALMAYTWPGNIRELRHEIARAALFLRSGELLESGHLRAMVREAPKLARGGLKEMLLSVERAEIESALGVCKGDPEQAAVRLGIGRSTIYRRMKALGIESLDTNPVGSV